jgi:dTDP-4-dehydrorhamnose 3,5-epimerase
MALSVSSTALPDIKIIITQTLSDSRGLFSEVYNRRDFEAAGLFLDFVQDNHSISTYQNTTRGLHFQRPPFAQANLVRAVRGRILDIAVDIRKSSPTFGHHVAVELSAENWRQLFIPVGFPHGFCTLEPNTEVVYKVTDYYSREHDRGIHWRDSDLAISWPLDGEEPRLSERDLALPKLSDLPRPRLGLFLHRAAEQCRGCREPPRG